MQRTTLARWFGALALVAAPAMAQQVSVTDFAKRPEAWGATLSPTGEYAAIEVPSADGLETQLQIVKLDGSGKTQTLRFGRMEHVSDVTWTADDRVVVARATMTPLDPRPYSTGQLMTSDVNGKNQDTLFGYVADHGNTRGRRKDEGWASLVDVLDEPGMALVDFTCATCGKEPDTVIYRVDTRTGDRKEVERGGKLAWYQFDRTGEARVRRTLDDNDDPVLDYRPAKGGDWKPLPKSIAGRQLYATVWEQDNNVLYAFVADGMEAAQPYRIDLAAGTRTKLDDHTDLTPSGWFLEGRNGAPFAVYYNNNQPLLKIIKPDSEYAKLYVGILKAFPGQMVYFNDYSRDNNRVLFSVASDKNAGDWYLYDRAAKKAQKVVEFRPWLKPETMAPSRPISFTNRDGTKIYGIYTAAAGTGPKPTIVMPHGGPYGVSDDWGFETDAQFFASRGYAVLQINYRGSDGRGEGFEKSGWKGWGDKIQNDITDGVKYAIDQKLADPNRICMYGASFGGYSAMMQPILNPGMYKCAIGYVGVYDMALMRKTDIRDGESDRIKRFWNRTVGTDMDALAKISPALRAKEINVPVMLVHGTADNTANMNQFRAMSAALKDIGQPAQEMLASGEGHGFVKPENVAELYRRMEAFLDKYIGPNAKVATSP